MTFGTFIRWAGFWMNEVAGVVGLALAVAALLAASEIMGGPI